MNGSPRPVIARSIYDGYSDSHRLSLRRPEELINGGHDSTLFAVQLAVTLGTDTTFPKSLTSHFLSGIFGNKHMPACYILTWNERLR
jgi:hypothetical protein